MYSVDVLFGKVINGGSVGAVQYRSKSFELLKQHRLLLLEFCAAGYKLPSSKMDGRLKCCILLGWWAYINQPTENLYLASYNNCCRLYVCV